MHDKNWSGGAPHESSSGGPPGRGPPLGQQQRAQQAAAQAAQESMQRFAHEFPSLDSGEGDNSKGRSASAQGKNQDNQYGPGPILTPQTEGSWTQGGGRGMQRPPGPPPPSSAGGAPGVSSSNRDFGPERPNMGGPTPPPMSLGQGGHPPPPLGAFPMQFPPRPPYMYPNSGPGGPGGPPGGSGFYPPGGMPGPRYGMPIPPDAPPPSSNHPSDGSREEGGPPPRRAGPGRGPPPGQMRPASHFTSKPIIKLEELECMDELGQQDGGWAAVQEYIDYNKKISFSDDEGQQGVGGDKENGRGRRLREDDRGESRVPREPTERDYPEDMRERSSRPMRILERPQASDSRYQRDSRAERTERDGGRGGDRYWEGDGPSSGRYQNDYDTNEQDDWKRKPSTGFDRGDRDGRGPLSQQNRGGRMMNRGPPREEESWRSGCSNRTSNFEDDPRKKDRSSVPLSGGRGERESRGVAPVERPSERSAGQGQNDRSNDMRRPIPERDDRRDRVDDRRERNDGPQRGSVGGGAGDFGSATGPFQNNLPPRLQRSFPPMFSQQQQERVGNQRKTPSPVPSGNAVNKERDYRDRSDRDWDRNERNDRDRDPQRPTPTYKILERNRGDSESSKDGSSHVHSRNNRLDWNDTDSVPTRIHRDGKQDSNKRLSSDSGRILLDEDSKMSPKDLDSMDSSYDSLRGGRSKHDIMEVSKSSSFTGPKGMGSWADEVDDEQDYSSSDIDNTGSRKGSLIRDLKRGDHQVHPVEERKPPVREIPVRVIIQQTKVQNMKSDIQEVRKAPEPQAAPEPKPEPVKIEKPPPEATKPKGFQWADRAKPAGADTLSSNQETKEPQSNKDFSDRDSSEKEIGKSRDEDSKTGKDDSAGSQKDGRYHDNSRYGGGRYVKGAPRDRDGRGPLNERQKSRRMDSYEQKQRDNRTPDRVDSGRSSQEKEREVKGLEKSKSGERLDKEKVSDKDFRLQGYGHPYDKTPFSSSGHKEGAQEGGKVTDAGSQQQSNKPAPVPLMALGDISPSNVQNKGGRGGGGREMERGRGGRGMPPRMQRMSIPEMGIVVARVNGCRKEAKAGVVEVVVKETRNLL